MLRRAFTLAVKAGLLPRRPSFPTLTLDNARRGFFDLRELEAVLPHLSAALRPMLRFGYLTGWRIQSEVQPLRWEQVDFLAGVVRLETNTTKNADGRTFPFSAVEPLGKLLLAQRSDTDTLELVHGPIPWVFHQAGKRILDFRDAWHRACEAAGLGHRIPHDFRRSAVRNLERAGVSRSTAMKLTGHKTETVYHRYAIVSESDLREGVTKLNASLAREEQAQSQAQSRDSDSGADHGSEF